jgi:2-C-methyl-D-erythritol 4-phosphate cytidylyltransferase/2-C-methyl-D-erythritol 2,4-cyclodiphosphate synthase
VPTTIETAVVVVAAGRGVRARGPDGVPKQYAMLAGRSVLARTLAPFLAHPAIAAVVVAIHPDDRALYEAAADGLAVTAAVDGGATRQASVLAGLEALAGLAPRTVLIHDAARPFVGRGTIDRVLAALATHPGAVAAEPLADTLKRAGPAGTIAETIPRAGLWRAQTPQGFRYEAILGAHRAAAAAGRDDFTDDAAIAEWAGLAVALVEGSSDNTKITTADDLARADRLLATPAPAAIVGTGLVRTGLGFDVHPFAEGDAVWLGGVRIPHTHRLAGHSDADVALHALTDALLGAIGDGDIGQHFPPSDMRWKGAASMLFLEDAVRRVRARGGHVVNVDLTILAEAPRIGPHRPAMQAAIAAALGVTPADVGIKATTTEQLGFVGRREGIAAMAVATVATE